jgi:hypothetical protein
MVMIESPGFLSHSPSPAASASGSGSLSKTNEPAWFKRNGPDGLLAAVPLFPSFYLPVFKASIARGGRIAWRAPLYGNLEACSLKDALSVSNPIAGL